MMRILMKNFTDQPSPNPEYPFSKDLHQFLTGKRLLPEELPFTNDLIKHQHQNGYLHFHHGVKDYICNRCGNKDRELFASFHCARCKKECVYCRKCIQMGRVSECTPLINWNGPNLRNATNHRLQWDGTLSKGQQLASDQVVQAVHNRTSLLVWAVCGAGKTEVLFKGIEAALVKGQRVCIATPRTDVALELAPRLQQVFPETDIAVLYGGSEDRMKNAVLTIATTHQLLRYYRAFDTIIIDEVDAFPYSMEPMLQYAANEARTEDGAIVYLSATPSMEMQREVRLKKLDSVVIPARYHGKPLPVPSFKWCGKWRVKLGKGRIPINVKLWLEEHFKGGKPIFLFVPDIELLEKVVGILQQSYGDKVAGVHSKDKERKEKVARFREGKVKILVTTTILERGVTVPNVQVGVLGAEDDIFTESALVQIAGRAGRNAKFASGDVRFFHYGKTGEMIRARDHIRRMNYRAKQGGFLHE
ncbi:competence protein ComFA [Bacillus tianshenii]|uniref:Competence protein ComFA n=1 Tax=Sutcliffiella tianshenii TaxID=1463404 RepID=A0ABS2NUP3_9BACI|nr:DEAD/DEAH box helicase [Bacillus tianshenii]MBM7618374.1 competence protein ComFA [Bacillus tianshenii]